MFRFYRDGRAGDRSNGLCGATHGANNAAYNPMSYDAARHMEVELAIDLREGGYGVWQA